MDFLNKSLAQLKDLFQSMTPGARITAALLLAVVVISLGYLVGYRTSGADTYLLGGESFAPSELQAMQAAFGSAGLGGYELEGTKVRIPRGKQAEYLAALVDGDALPDQFGKAYDDAVEGGSPFDGKDKQKERLKAAKERELSLIIRSMKGIEKASVLLDSQTESGFRGETIKTASVSAKALGTQQLDQEQVRKIRYTVSAAVAGMKPENVTVTDFNGAVYTGSGGTGSLIDDPYFDHKQEYERIWQRNILAALRYVPGVTVTTNVELDKKQSIRSVEVKHDPKPIPLRTMEKENTLSREGGSSGGRPGYAGQQPTANAGSSLSVASGRGGGSREETTDSQTETVNTVGGKQTTTDEVGLTPTRVTASIGIPTSYFVTLWNQRNPPTEGEEAKTPDRAELDKIRQEETTKIKQHVTLLLPQAGVTDPTALVSVTEFQDIAPPEIPAPGMSEKAVTWLGQYWTTLAMLGLAGFSLLMLRSMTRSAPRPASKAAAPASKTAGSSADTLEPEEQESPAAWQPKLHRFTGSGPSLRDELSELVIEDPESAANILRAWIGAPAKP